MRDWFASVDPRTRRVVAGIAMLLLVLMVCSRGDDPQPPDGLVGQSTDTAGSGIGETDGAAGALDAEGAEDGLAQPLQPPAGSDDQAAGGDGSGGDPDPAAVPANAQPATVTFIIDGDTIDVEVTEQSTPDDSVDHLIPPGEHRIRLLEIDTPEMDDDCYQTATELLAELIPVGTQVFLEPDVEDLDPNDRYLRYVWLPDGTLVNLVMVEEGMAEAFIFPLNQAHAPEILGAEADAEELGLGIWGPYCDGRA